MSKTTYQNLITVPTAGTDTISDGSTIGGDIVANFKLLADQIHPDGVCGAVAAAGGPTVFEGSTTLTDIGKYVVNNTVIGTITGSSPVESYESSGGITAGQGSGAFMKGTLIIQCYSDAYKLIDVPYVGGMIIRYDILASENSALYTETGSMQVFDCGIDGGSKETPLGSFTVENGDLVFTPSAAFTCLQIGLHGTILCGSYNLVSGQTSSMGYETDYSS